MNDRDRLAADLAAITKKDVEWLDAYHYEGSDAAAAVMADRLIALGWTRLDEVHRRLHPSHPPLPVCEYADCSFAKANIRICPDCGEVVDGARWHPGCCPHHDVEDCDDRDGYMGRRYDWCNDCNREVISLDGEGWEVVV